MNVAVQKTRKARLPLRILHWLTAIAITFAWIFVYSKGLFAKGSPERVFLAGAHVFAGLTVLTLLPLRVAARWLWALPAIEPSPPLWQMRLSSVVQILLYAGMLSTPVLGVLLMQSSGKELAFLGLTLPALVDANKTLSHTIRAFSFCLYGMAGVADISCL